MPNRLQHERSLYLRQHADQPVDWWPWGAAALAEAAALDRPLFISIGYSSCHWCHVMAEESFADPTIAEVLNRHFVSIKIDREEHPDIDQQYMTAVLLTSGHGGWPMSVFALPDGRPFFAGTYFPPFARWGQPGFADLVARIAELWHRERQKIEFDAAQIARGVAARSAALPPADVDNAGFAEVLARSLRRFDRHHGGVDGAPKFPPHEDLRLWLHAKTHGFSDPDLDLALRTTLDVMAYSGLRDLVGGGFHRYCVDHDWRVPHFEKMLYDNVQLLQAYTDAWALSGHAQDAEVVDQLLAELGEQWRTPGGWLAASFDADDPNGEGAYYTWTPDELLRALGREDGGWAVKFFQVSEHGPVEGRSTLVPLAPPARITLSDGVGTPDAVHERLARIRPKLRAARAARPAPARDDKGIVAHNGWALGTLAAVRRARGPMVERDWAAFADVCLARASEPLPRAWYDGDSRGAGQLDDYVALAWGLWRWGLETDDTRYVSASLTLMHAARTRFFGHDGWVAARSDGPLGDPPGFWDGQEPSAFSAALDLLSEVENLTGDEEMGEAADRLLYQSSGAMARAPEGTRGLWRAYHRRARGIPTVIVAGRAADEWVQALAPRSPFSVVWVRPRVSAWALEQGWAALSGRGDPGPVAWACSGRTCLQPARDPEALRRALVSLGSDVG